jgi:hypothetical protein
MEQQMGYLNALAIAAAPLTLAEKLKWHQCDFSVKVPNYMLEIWQQAIQLHDLGLPEVTMIDLPAGATFKGGSQASIAEIITGYNLEYFTRAFASEVPDSPLDVPLEKELNRQNA